MRVVLDTNVLLDGVEDNFSVQVKLMEAVIAQEGLVALASKAVKREYHRLIKRIITDQSYLQKLAEFLEQLEEVKAQTISVLIDDEEDLKFVAAAVGGKADLIVTSDRHLLDLGEVENISIVTPQEAWHKWQEEGKGGAEWQKWARDLGISS